MFTALKKKKGPNRKLRAVLRDYELPSFPGSVARVLEVIRDPDASLETIAAAMQRDPALAVKLLKTVNSAAFGLVTEVVNVGHAVSLMGRPRVESLVVALATRRLLPRDEVAGFDAGRFWRAAARRATLARPLAQRLHPATEAESFTAALLQDMALPVLAHSRNEDYAPILEHWNANPESDLGDLEMAAFGWTHSDLGYLMAREWGLPEKLSAAIGGHHQDDDDSAREPAVFLVSHIRENEDTPGIERLVEAARTAYGMKPDDVTALIDAAWQDAADLAAILT